MIQIRAGELHRRPMDQTAKVEKTRRIRANMGMGFPFLNTYCVTQYVFKRKRERQAMANLL